MHKHWLVYPMLWTLLLLAACSGNSGSSNSPPVINSNQMGGAIEVKLPALAGTVTTFAGVAPGIADGTGAAARFTAPHGMATDGTSIFVADSGNHTIRKIAAATGAVTTLAGAARVSGTANGTGSGARFFYPEAVVIVGTNLYVSDLGNCTIRKVVISTGEVTTFAGTAGVPGSSDGIGVAALFRSPAGLASDGTCLYVGDVGNRTIRKIVIATGEVTTLAGSAGANGFADGTGTAARFAYPVGVATDGESVFVTDSMNQNIRRVVIASGMVTTVAGSAGTTQASGSDGIGTAAHFGWPVGISLSGTKLYVTDDLTNDIKVVDTVTGAVTTLISHIPRASNGTVTIVDFRGLWGITTDGSSVYVSEGSNNTIRKIEIANLSVTTLAGLSTSGFVNGLGTSASFDWPQDVTTDGTSLFVADTLNNAIRRIDLSTGAVTKLATIFGAQKLTTDGVNLYVADYLTVSKVVISTGEVTTLAGDSRQPGSRDGTGTAAQFSSLGGITTDGTNLFLVDAGNYTIRKIAIATGEVTTLAGTAGLSGVVDGAGPAARFGAPLGITTDGNALYLTDRFDHTIRKVVIAGGAVTTLAGRSGVAGTDDGIETAASFWDPNAITTDGSSLFVLDRSSGTVRKIVIATREVTTLAGTAWTNGSSDGTGASALFSSPSGITTDGKSLFIVDAGNDTIRRLQ